MADHILIIRINHTGYSCCLCQQWHDKGSATIARHPDYDAHLYRQSKHGLQGWTENQCYRVVGEEFVRVPACEVMGAGEY